MTSYREKIVRVGKYKGHHIYCKITFANKRLSISGVIGPDENGDAWGGCGQIDMEFKHKKFSHDNSRYTYDELIKPNEIDFAPGWDKDKWYKFLKYWHLYHLNDMQAGCKHQRKLNWNTEKHLSMPCPVCGYKYGHAWLFMPVPKKVIRFLGSLPNADLNPAWI